MIRKIGAALLVASALSACPAYSAESEIRSALQNKFRDAPIESISKTPFSGIYEVVLGGRVLYTDEKGSFVFIGNLIDLRGPSERDLTDERTSQLTAQALKQSADLAIKRVRGNGRRVIYTFEDPNCGWCRKFHGELARLNNVTIYTFLWPILSPESTEKSKMVWCARDRVKAWDDVMTRGNVQIQDGGKNCDTPIDKNLALAKRFGARGTPAVYLADGRQVGGFLPADKLEEALTLVSGK
jgi:thiol:disulfide interchange protein DsbC